VHTPDPRTTLLVVITGAAVAQPDPLHRSRADPGLHPALRAVAVPNHAITPVPKLHTLHRREERVGLGFNGLRQQPPRTVAQNRRQWIVGLVVGLTERNNGAIARYGVSLLREVQAGFHPPRYAAFLKSPSPSFGDSSDAGGWGTLIS
jgi:hypothetical protein